MTIALLATGCSGGSDTEPFSEAASALRATVDATVSEVAPGYTWETLDPPDDPQGCGSETSTEFIDYVLSAPVPAAEQAELVERISRYWRTRGAGTDADPGSRVAVTFDGYAVGLTTFPADGRITVEGSTDCFEP